MQVKSRRHLWDDPYLYRVCSDSLLRRCVPTTGGIEIIERCHAASYGGHYGVFHTKAKIWQCGFFWPTMYEDTKEFIRRCWKCQFQGSINARNAMSLHYNLQIEIFDVWGHWFHGSVPKVPRLRVHPCWHWLRVKMGGSIAMLSCWHQACKEDVPWGDLPSLWNTKDGDKRWGISLHRQDIQSIPKRAWS